MCKMHTAPPIVLLWVLHEFVHVKFVEQCLAHNKHSIKASYYTVVIISGAKFKL